MKRLAVLGCLLGMACWGVSVRTAALADQEQGAAADKPDPADIRAAYRAAGEKAEKAETGADGVAAWEAFLATYGDSPQGEPARKELAIWKDRADKDMVRFGPGWAPRTEVEKRKAEADELVGKADSTQDPVEAGKLFDQASRSNPYRADIPFRKAAKFYQAKRLREAGMAWGDALKIDSDHVGARTNVGVLAAQNKNWGPAIAHLSKAAAVGAGDDRVWDNLDQAIASAEADGYPAASVAAAERQVQLAVRALHKDGKHDGETRWGNSWIPQDEYDRMVKENDQIDKDTAANQRKLELLDRKYRRAKKTLDDYNKRAKALQSGTMRMSSTNPRYFEEQKKKAEQAAKDMRECEVEGKKLQAEVKQAQAKKNKPSHSGRLVLLDLGGGGELGTVDAGDGGKPEEKKVGGGLFD